MILPKPLFAATVLEEFKSALKRKNLDREEETHKADLTDRRVLLAEDIQQRLQAGLNAHLSKPVQPEALFETLESLIKD